MVESDRADWPLGVDRPPVIVLDFVHNFCFFLFSLPERSGTTKRRGNVAELL